MNLLTFAANRSSFKKNVLKTREGIEDFIVKAIAQQCADLRSFLETSRVYVKKFSAEVFRSLR